ncbi:YchJ family protein [Comamonas composti]|uniref:YchJ family protein n=1 Tax=Comamonas composti TaxID=408558 RepID=UPI000479A9D2|nr:YchJ family metal-binding protein [Comamonas composti]
MNTLLTKTCPCGQLDARRRPLNFEACCGRYLPYWQDCPAPDAQALMRSRYTAFVLEDKPYLLATWHASQRPERLEFEPAAKWLGLELKSFGITGEDAAEVEFVARYRSGGRGVRLHERSRFVREDGRWYYLDGETP